MDVGHPALDEVYGQRLLDQAFARLPRTSQWSSPFPFRADTMIVPFLPAHMYSIYPSPISLQLCFPFTPVGPGTRAPSTSMCESSTGQVSTFCLMGPPCCWLCPTITHTVLVGSSHPAYEGDGQVQNKVAPAPGSNQGGLLVLRGCCGRHVPERGL